MFLVCCLFYPFFFLDFSYSFSFFLMLLGNLICFSSVCQFCFKTNSSSVEMSFNRAQFKKELSCVRKKIRELEKLHLYNFYFFSPYKYIFWRQSHVGGEMEEKRWEFISKGNLFAFCCCYILVESTETPQYLFFSFRSSFFLGFFPGFFQVTNLRRLYLFGKQNVPKNIIK